MINRTQSVEFVTHAVGMFIVTWLSGQASFEIPGLSVPITLQSLAVILIPMLFGYGALVGLAIWLVSGTFGLPVFAGGSGGLSIIFSNSGGFLIGFLAIALGAIQIKNWVHLNPLRNGLPRFYWTSSAISAFWIDMDMGWGIQHYSRGNPYCAISARLIN